MDEIRPYSPPQREIQRQIQPTIDIEVLPPEPDLLPSYYGKLFNTMAGMSSKDAQPVGGKNAKKIAIRRKNVMLLIDRVINNIPVVWGINAHKLLCKALGAFIMTNPALNAKTINSVAINYEVNIPFIEYCTDMGYDVIPHDSSAAEKRRAGAVLRKVKQRTLEDLERLREVKPTWTEALKKGGKALARIGEPGAIDKDFINYSLIGSRGIVDGYIKLTIDPKLVKDYLMLLPQTKYHRKLFKVKTKTAYLMGLALLDHYIKPSNVNRKVNNRMKNKSVLQSTDLPTIEDIEGAIDPDTGRRAGGKHPGHWKPRIKEPFEKALDELYSVGFIFDWGYFGKGGRALSYSEATEAGAEAWGETYLYYDIKGNITIEQS